MRRPLNLPSDREARGRTLGEEELALLKEVIRSGKLNATGGVMVPRFEEEFARLQGLPHAVALSSGSAAVHTALAALDLEPGDEVVTSSVTDMGALAPILWQGALPVFCDLDPDTLVMTGPALKARITPRTRAVVVTHLFGHPCPMDEILEAAGSIPVVEDCAQAPLASWKGRLVGTFGKLAAYSFQQGKHITCGEGGIVLTSDPVLARRARLFANKGWPYGEPSPDHEFLAMNFRMTELQGAVLLAQLSKLEEVVRL
ncbi:MAG TPA: DegT/DnrJ/EryC1/StrS family aminotransferase, partial [Planctomycetes bacterium]|nr:DegT/DnrJ/EryC1/StrS family aminotransferase [Planctomycetota bacterium]